MRRHWDCWDTDTPPTTSQPPTSVPPPSGGPEPEVCYPPRIDMVVIGKPCLIEIFITKG